jgi:hypothetical protein
MLQGLGLAALLPLAPSFANAQDAKRPQLPLKTTGLEHMGTVVPDVEAAGKFYGRLFKPELHKEKEPPLPSVIWHSAAARISRARSSITSARSCRTTSRRRWPKS